MTRLPEEAQREAINDGANALYIAEALTMEVQLPDAGTFETHRRAARFLRVVEENVDAAADSPRRLIDGSFFVFGLDPLARKHTYRSVDMIRWINALMEDQEDITFIVADMPLDSNIFDALKKKEMKRKGEKRSDAELMWEAQERARLIGIKDVLFIQAVQDYVLRVNHGNSPMEGELTLDNPDLSLEGLLTTEAIINIMKSFSTGKPGHKRKEVRLMSQYLRGHEGFSVTYARLERLVASDLKLAEMFLDCVPESLVVSNLGIKKGEALSSLREAFALSDPADISDFLNLFRYTLTETAIILLSGKKYGHDGEKVYDEVAIYVFDNYAPYLGLSDKNRPQFEYPEVKMSGRNPYRTMSLEQGSGRDDVFSVNRAFGEMDFDAALHFFDLEFYPICKRHFELIDQAASFLTEQDRDFMKRAEAKKLMKEAVIEILRVPVFARAMSNTDVMNEDLPPERVIEIILQALSPIDDRESILVGVYSFGPIVTLMKFLYLNLTGRPLYTKKPDAWCL